MLSRVNRETVDLSSYPDLVVVYLGMRVNRLYGLRTLMARGPRIGRSDDKPEGLLAHETLLWSLFPMHLGIRQYWRDLPALLTWARSEPHRLWWRDFLRDMEEDLRLPPRCCASSTPPAKHGVIYWRRPGH